jgi:hypothetical protein
MAAEICSSGGSARSSQVDVTGAADAERMVAAAIAAFGRLARLRGFDPSKCDFRIDRDE